MITQTEKLLKMPKKESEEASWKLMHIYDILTDMTQPDYDEYLEIIREYGNTVTKEEFDAYTKKHEELEEKHAAYLELRSAVLKIHCCQRRSFEAGMRLKEAIDTCEYLGLNVY